MWWLRAPTAIRRPISRVRSVTETSMMFMMPTPPTTSEIRATASNKVLIDWVVDDIIFDHFRHVADVEVVVVARPDAVPLAQQFRDLRDGQLDLRVGEPPWR